MTCDFVKSTDRVDAIGPDGKVIAYIEKRYFGTHGNSRGWDHYVFSNELGSFAWAGAIGVDKLGHPWVFGSIKEFKEYYAAQ